MLLYGFAAFVALILFVCLWGIWTNRKENAQSDKDKNKIRTSRSGKQYYWGYPSTLNPAQGISELSIPANLAFEFRLEHEGKGQLFAKRLGFANKYQTNDRQFDDRVYILSDDVEFCDRFRDNPVLRRIVLDLFTRDVESLFSKDGRLTITLKIFQALLQEETVDFLVQALDDFKQKLSVAENVQYAVSKTRINRNKAIFFEYIWCAFITFAIAQYLMAMIKPFKPIHHFDLMPLGAMYAMVFMAFFLLLLNQVFRKSAWGYNALKSFIKYGIIGIFLSCWGIVYYGNISWDKSPVAVYTQSIIDKDYKDVRRSGRDYYISINNWHAPSSFYTIHDVSLSKYREAAVGKHLAIAVHPGYFGSEWIENYEVVP